MTWLLSDFISYPHPHANMISTQICCYSSNKHANMVPITGLSKHKFYWTKLNQTRRQCSSLLQQRRSQGAVSFLKQSTIEVLRAGVRERDLRPSMFVIGFAQKKINFSHIHSKRTWPSLAIVPPPIKKKKKNINDSLIFTCYISFHYLLLALLTRGLWHL